MNNIKNLGLRESYKEYVVKKGDSLFTIAKQYNTSIQELTDINMLTNNTIYHGQVLLVPDISSVTDFVLDVHITEDSDTFDGIAKKYNVDVERLAMFNDVGNLLLKENQKIYIPKERTYVVDSSDTVESILLKTNRTAEELLKANASNWLRSGNRIVS